VLRILFRHRSEIISHFWPGTGPVGSGAVNSHTVLWSVKIRDETASARLHLGESHYSKFVHVN